MPVFAILVGAALTFLGLDGYFAFVNVLGVPQEQVQKSITGLIPAFVGGPLIVCGLLALNPNLLKHAMHAAATLGLLGFLASAGRLGQKAASGGVEWTASAKSQAVMAGLCLAFVIGCVMSFIAARKRRTASAV